MYNFEKLSIGDVNVDEYENSFDNKNLFCTVEWLSFLSVFRKVTPIVIRITDNKKFVGYFSGAFFSKFDFQDFVGQQRAEEFAKKFGLLIAFSLFCNGTDDFVESVRSGGVKEIQEFLDINVNQVLA